MLKVAIIGCGKIADDHLQQIQRIQRIRECRVIATCDREPLMAKQLCRAIPDRASFQRRRGNVGRVQTGRRPHHHFPAEPLLAREALPGTRLSRLYREALHGKRGGSGKVNRPFESKGAESDGRA